MISQKSWRSAKTEKEQSRERNYKWIVWQWTCSDAKSLEYPHEYGRRCGFHRPWARLHWYLQLCWEAFSCTCVRKSKTHSSRRLTRLTLLLDEIIWISSWMKSDTSLRRCQLLTSAVMRLQLESLPPLISATSIAVAAHYGDDNDGAD